MDQTAWRSAVPQGKYPLADLANQASYGNAWPGLAIVGLRVSSALADDRSNESAGGRLRLHRVEGVEHILSRHRV
jgi:hypothetical protein